jgi:hypothetical protein
MQLPSALEELNFKSGKIWNLHLGNLKQTVGFTMVLPFFVFFHKIWKTRRLWILKSWWGRLGV